MPDQNNITVFILATTALILLLTGFIITMVYLYQKKHFTYQQNLKEINLNHEKHLLQTQLEIQEQIFQDVSRDIHDNISLSLTLSKLHLNTLPDIRDEIIESKIALSVGLIGDAIHNLSNISKSLNADIIRNHGMLEALKNEVSALLKTGLFEIDYIVTGTPVFMDSEKELIMFRIVQEAFNNIIKHANAKRISLLVEYTGHTIEISIEDDGIGFCLPEIQKRKNFSSNAGLNNMRQRTKLVHGDYIIESLVDKGTKVKISVPI